MIVRVYHSEYGCDTGCCGHTIEIDDNKYKFEFTHPYGDDRNDLRGWALGLAKRVVKENWPECYNSIDWDSLNYGDVADD